MDLLLHVALHVYPPTPHAPAGVEGPPHNRLPPWPRLPRPPCPTLLPNLYYFYITVAMQRHLAVLARRTPHRRAWLEPPSKLRHRRMVKSGLDPWIWIH